MLIYDIENLPSGIAFATALRDMNNRLSVRCKHCGEVFDISEDQLGEIIKCPNCNVELQINNFTAFSDSIIIDEIETDKPEISNEEMNVTENNTIKDNAGDQKKKGFFSRLFKK